MTTPPELPGSGVVRAVVLDASSMSRGRLSLDLLHQIVDVIRDRGLGAEVWIPEPVLWEWVEHAHADLTAHVERHSTLRESLRDAGLGGRVPELADDILDIDSLIVGIERALQACPEIRILRLLDHPDTAYGGLRDQVLQVGAGRTKGAAGRSVKTGASDGASCRLVELTAGADVRDIALVSGDGDMAAYFSSRESPVIFRSWADLRARLVHLKRRDEVASDDFAALARELLVSSDRPAVSQSLEARNQALREFLSAAGHLETSMTLGPIRAVDEIREIELSDDGGFATAVVSAAVDAELTGVYWNDAEDVLEEDFDVVPEVPAQLSIEATRQDGVWSFVVVDGFLLDEGTG